MARSSVALKLRMVKVGWSMLLVVIGLPTIRQHHGLVVLVEGRPTHVAHQATVAAVGEGKMVGQSVQH